MAPQLEPSKFASTGSCGLSFAQHFSPLDFLLLEVDKELADAIQSGQELTVRGRESDNVVVCTDAKTYATKEVEISNEMVLVNGAVAVGDKSALIVSVSSRYLELEEGVAHGAQIVRLRELLRAHQADDFFAGEQQTPQNGTNLRELLNELQISETQLREAIRNFPVVESEGRLYLLSTACIQRVLDAVTELCDDQTEEEISAQHFTEHTLADRLRQTELVLPSLSWFIRLYCLQNDNGTHSLCPERVCRARIEQLLRADNRCQWTWDEFQRRLGTLLPNGIDFRERHLAGLCLVTESLVYGRTLSTLIAEDLPTNLRERLDRLFALKSAWSKDELQPYVADYCANAAKLEEFLMRHCKCVGSGPRRYFIAKQF